MRWIVSKSLQFRFVVAALAASMMVFGVGQVQKMPVDVFPEFAPPRVEVQTMSFGLSATEVEELITVPLEQVLAGLPDLDQMRSKSVVQLSSIELIFERGVDLFEARQNVQERLATITATLPTWASPPFILQPLSATSRAMKVGISSDTLSTIDLSMLAYWKIRTRLLRIPGVANVTLYGERIRMTQVQVQPELMAEKKVSLDKVMETTSNALAAGILRYEPGSVIGTGGEVETPNQRMPVQHVLPILSPKDLGEAVIENRPEGPLRLKDVATLTEGAQPLFGDAVINGGDGLMLIVEKLPWGNNLDIARDVDAAFAEMKPALQGVEVDTSIFRPASYVQTSIDNLTGSLLEGSILVLVVLLLFLFDWRSALISVITIPLSLMAALMVMAWRGVTMNTMILAGLIIALGAVVDDAIVDIENIIRRLREARENNSPQSTASIILEGSLEVRGAVVYASLIEALALLPIFFLEGLTGAFFKPLAFSYALAVIVSMTIALIVTPALSLILLSIGKINHRTSPIVRVLQRGYRKVLTPLVRNPWPGMAGALAIAASGFIIVPGLGQELLPDFKERDFLMHWLTKPGTSIDEEVRVTKAAYADLIKIPGVRNFGSHIGQAMQADEVYGVDFGENWISIEETVDYDKTLAEVQKVVDRYPGLRRDVQTYLKERTREVLAGSSHPIVIRIYGEDLEKLQEKADEAVKVLESIEGVEEEHKELVTKMAQLRVKVDLDKAQAVGLKPGDVRRAASTIISGEEVGDIFYGGQAFDVNVWTPLDKRDSITDVENMLLDTPSGETVRLADIATVAIQPTYNSVKRENSRRRLDVDAEVKGRDLGSIVDELEEKMDKVEFEVGYSYRLLGDYTERKAASRKLNQWALAAAAGIFLLLMVALKSVRLSVLSYITLPMALIGGAIAVWIQGGIISLGSLVGFFTVLGIVARNGIMLLSHYQHLEQFEGETFGVDMVIRGAVERLAPIMMTALTTGLALVPLVLSGNLPGQEIEYPMAIVILGGLIVATILNLFIVPGLYYRFGKKKRERDEAAAKLAGPAGAAMA